MLEEEKEKLDKRTLNFANFFVSCSIVILEFFLLHL